MNERPQNVAAVVNGLLVLIVPVAFVAVTVLATGSTADARFTNVPAPPQTSAFLVILQAALAMLPLSAFAAWRTRVMQPDGGRDRSNAGGG